jgi:TonB family protein
MQTREQFSGYLLLKKLAEDPLGETFRAGKVGKAGLDRVALLRVFNGQGLDGETLWQRVSARAGIQQVLKNPNLGDGIDMGQMRGTPYVAYDYVSGKNLAALLGQATQKRQPVPLDHALLISERIALGLSVAAESRLGEDRVLHGFVVPHLVMVSNEGETRLLGFEVGPALREVATSAAAREQFARYLAPEALGGGAAGKSDDVYSLGAILFEMLTGKRLPPPAASGYAGVIDGAMLAGEGTPIPADLGNLLKKSLSASSERLPDAVTWHKAITKLMLDGHYNPTTFNLAFFMHNLFREDIERETQELQAEKNIKVTAPAAPTPAAAAPAVAPPAAPRFGLREEGPARETTFAGAAAASSGSNKGMIIGIAAAAALILGGGLYWLLSRGGTTTPPAQQSAAPAQPAGLTPEELQAQIDKLVSEKLAEMNKAATTSATQATQDAAKKEEQIKALQRQLEDARRVQSERPATAPSRPAPAPPPAAAPTTVTTATPPTAAAATPPVATPSSSGLQPTTPAAPAAPAPSTPPAPVPAAPAPQPEAPPAEPTVRRGDLVTPGQGVSRPQFVSMPNPRYPEIAKRTNRAATVVVPILVDENGNVAQTKPPAQKAGFGFDEAALDAARRASFRPATKNGVPVKMWMELSVVFKQ